MKKIFLAVVFLIFFATSTISGEIVAFSATGEYFLTYQTEMCLDIQGTYTVFNSNYTREIFADPQCQNLLLVEILLQNEWSYPIDLASHFHRQLKFFQDSQCQSQIGGIFFQLDTCLPSVFHNSSNVKWREASNGLHSDGWFDSSLKCPLNPDTTSSFARGVCDFSIATQTYYFYSEASQTRFSAITLFALMFFLIFINENRTLTYFLALFGLLTFPTAYAEERHLGNTSQHSVVGRVTFPSTSEPYFSIAESDSLEGQWDIYAYTSRLEVLPLYLESLCNPCNTDNIIKVCHAGIRLNLREPGMRGAKLPLVSIFIDYGYTQGSKVLKYQILTNRVPAGTILGMGIVAPTATTVGLTTLAIIPSEANAPAAIKAVQQALLYDSAPPTSEYPNYHVCHKGYASFSIHFIKSLVSEYIGAHPTYYPMSSNCQSFVNFFLQSIPGGIYVV